MNDYELDPRIKTGIPAQVKVVGGFFLFLGLSWLITALFGVGSIQAVAGTNKACTQEPLIYALGPYVVSWKCAEQDRSETWLWFFGYTKQLKVKIGENAPKG